MATFDIATSEDVEALKASVDNLARVVEELKEKETPQSQPLLISAAEAGAILGICRNSFVNLVSEGKAPKPVELSDSLKRWRRVDVEAMAKRRAMA